MPTQIETLNDWYETHLPPDKPWGHWTWYSPTGPHCLNFFHGSAGSSTWQWQEGASVLSLSSLNNSANNPNGLVFINLNILPKSPLAACS